MKIKEILDIYFSTIRKYLPEERENTSIGIDIGAHSCKLVELVKKQGALELRQWAIEPIENGDAKTALQNIFARVNLPVKTGVTAVSGKGTLIRFIDMPRMSLEDLSKSFAIEADKYFPFDHGSVYTDCAILDPKSKDKKMAVLVAAVKKEMVDQRLKILSELSFDISAVTINAIAVANVYDKVRERQAAPAHTVSASANSALAVLDIGESVSNLIILKDGLPRFSRDIYIGSQEFTKRISNVMGVGAKDAERLKFQDDGQQETVFSICEPTIMNLVSEIRLSCDYFITEKNILVDQLLLTGGGSRLKGLEEAVAKSLEIPVHTWDPFAELQVTLADGVPAVGAESVRLTVALGLALNS